MRGVVQGFVRQSPEDTSRSKLLEVAWEETPNMKMASSIEMP